MDATHFELLALNKDTSEPLYLQLAAQIAQQIENGILLPNQRLPATRELADLLGVARISVVNAYDALKDDGYIEAYVGRGTFVSDVGKPISRVASMISTINEQQRQTLNALMRMANRPNVVDFGRGYPPDIFLPVDLIRTAINQVLTRDGAEAVAYEDAEGYYPLRQSISRLLSRQGIKARADEILITGGCQQALDLVVQSLLKSGDVILTGSPTYTGILRITAARDMQPIGVPVGQHGLDIDQLEAAIKKYQPALIYVAPTFQNPTGSIMPMPQRRRLIEIATRYQIPILEDGVYEELSYEGEFLPALKALDSEGLVLYASSFSKILLPGMRIGYLAASERLLKRLIQVKYAADVCTPALNQRALQAVVESDDFREHLTQVRKACLKRRYAMVEAFREHLPEAHFQVPQGGLYLWVSLPDAGPTAIELYAQAIRPADPEQTGIAFAPGPLFYPNSGGDYQMRLNMVSQQPEAIYPAIERLAEAYYSLSGAGRRTNVASSLL